ALPAPEPRDGAAHVDHFARAIRCRDPFGSLGPAVGHAGDIEVAIVQRDGADADSDVVRPEGCELTFDSREGVGLLLGVTLVGNHGLLFFTGASAETNTIGSRRRSCLAP